jgi:BolA protein
MSLTDQSFFSFLAKIRAAARAMAATVGPLQARMTAAITQALAPLHIQFENESSKHGGGSDAESHFKVLVVSAAFAGKSLLDRHRQVNDAVKEGATNIPVHALSISAKTPEQWAAAGGAAAPLHATPTCKGGEHSGGGGSSSS